MHSLTTSKLLYFLRSCATFTCWIMFVLLIFFSSKNYGNTPVFFVVLAKGSASIMFQIEIKKLTLGGFGFGFLVTIDIIKSDTALTVFHPR